MADPHLVAKVAAGEEDRIRPCVGANYCLDAIYQSGDAKCIHNAGHRSRADAAATSSAAAPARRRAVVVGAGPAGLEAARVLGERGHEVVRAGGRRPPRRPGAARRGLGAATRPDRDRRLAGLGGQAPRRRRSATAAYADAATVLAEQPDVVVVATGGLPNTAFAGRGRAPRHSTPGT